MKISVWYDMRMGTLRQRAIVRAPKHCHDAREEAIKSTCDGKMEQNHVKQGSIMQAKMRFFSLDN